MEPGRSWHLSTRSVPLHEDADNLQHQARLRSAAVRSVPLRGPHGAAIQKQMTGDLRPELDRHDDVVAHVAVTLDGFLAHRDGSVDYLEKYPIDDFGFEAWVGRVGGLAMGSATYRQVVEWGWTWGDMPTLVLSSSDRAALPMPDGGNITVRSAPTAQAISEFAATLDKRLWVFGGGDLITAALLGGVVDTLDLVIVPEAIGTGLPLFSGPVDIPMTLLNTYSYRNGAARLVYDVSR